MKRETIHYVAGNSYGTREYQNRSCKHLRGLPSDKNGRDTEGMESAMVYGLQYDVRKQSAGGMDLPDEPPHQYLHIEARAQAPNWTLWT